MDHLLYVAASGANEAMLAQSVNSHNLANASTTGFRADLVQAHSRYLAGEGQASRTYAVLEDNGADLSHGVLNATGRELDVAVNGRGWIAVQAADGSEGYTRRGDLRVDEFGQLVNGAGQQVLGNGGPIALPPYAQVAIGADGTVSIVPLGEQPNAMVALDRIKLVNPDNAALQKSDEGLLQLGAGDAAPADAAVGLVSGTLESSNVNSVAAMVQMIETARQFETHVKMMKIAEQLDTASTSLMSLN